MLRDPDLVSVQEVRAKVEQAYSAWQAYRHFSQEQIDAVVEAAAAVARTHARRLAELAVQETGYGNAADKLAKNLLCADLLPRMMRGVKTVGVLREDPAQRVVEIAVPMGVVAAILPTTNPTSTAIYKTLIALKSGNAIVHSPHPRARRCTCETVALLQQAAAQAGAPEGLIGCVLNATLEGTEELMRHRRTAVILSTGGAGIVRAAYSSGKPAFGVGPGNVPVLLDAQADFDDALNKVVAGKSFDFGTVCSSEQTIVAEAKLREAILNGLKARKAHVCDAGQTQALARLLLTPSFTVNPECVGQSPQRIAELAGFQAPPDASILVVEIEGVGKQHPLSAEKLSPVLSLLFVKDFDAALDACEAILRFGGLGHTAVIHSRNEARVRHYASRMPAMRVLANTSSPQGSTGITTGLFPSMTLGCGAWAGNITGDNIGPLNLINVKRLAWEVRPASEAFEIPTADAAPAAADGASCGVCESAVAPKLVAESVDRFLRSRNVLPASPGSTSAVDRFLEAKRAATTALSTIAAPGGAFSPYPRTGAGGSAAVAETAKVTDFVCEEDVRNALRQGQKIHIGPKTIVTPSARDLAAPHDVLVQTKRD